MRTTPTVSERGRRAPGTASTFALAALLLAVASSAAHATDEPLASDLINTDRPGAAYASTTVHQWQFELEVGIEARHSSAAGASRTLMPLPMFIRFGLHDRFELRLEGDTFAGLFRSGQSAHFGFSDLGVGFKVMALAENRGFKPLLSFLAVLFTPIGTDELTVDKDQRSRGLAPLFMSMATWGLGAGFALNLNAGADIVAPSGVDRHARFRQVTNVTYTLPVWRQRLSFWAEGSFIVPVKSGLDALVTFDAGALLLLTPNIQLDFQALIGLTDAADDIVIGGGFSFRT